MCSKPARVKVFVAALLTITGGNALLIVNFMCHQKYYICGHLEKYFYWVKNIWHTAFLISECSSHSWLIVQNLLLLELPRDRQSVWKDFCCKYIQTVKMKWDIGGPILWVKRHFSVESQSGATQESSNLISTDRVTSSVLIWSLSQTVCWWERGWYRGYNTTHWKLFNI